MPTLRVEYSPSARATCGLKQCGKRIAKNEVRVGTAILLPYNDGLETWKWRHLCCFTQRQLDNFCATRDLDTPDRSELLGYDTLAKSDKALVDAMLRGELIDKTEIIGRVGDVAHAPLTQAQEGAGRGARASHKAKDGDATAPSLQKSRTKKTSSRPAPRSRTAVASDVDSEATEEYEVTVTTTRPQCPYGSKCFRTDPEHFTEYVHGDARDDAAGVDEAASGKKRPVILRKKRARD